MHDFVMWASVVTFAGVMMVLLIAALGAGR